MKIIRTAIPDVLVFEPHVHHDDRGYFMETWKQSQFKEVNPIYTLFKTIKVNRAEELYEAFTINECIHKAN